MDKLIKSVTAYLEAPIDDDKKQYEAVRKIAEQIYKGQYNEFYRTSKYMNSLYLIKRL